MSSRLPFLGLVGTLDEFRYAGRVNVTLDEFRCIEFRYVGRVVEASDQFRYLVG